ncbi:MAG TPA: TadE family protein [Candidatus Limnocylindrales bacterium]|jgi:Flp pilus assembly protein TadG
MLRSAQLRRPRRLGSSRSPGQAIVEFALVVPVFLMIFFGTVDFGMAFNASLTISNAAREGARTGVTNPTTAAVTARVKAVVGSMNDSKLSVSVSCLTPGNAACAGGMAGAATGDTLVVTVGYDYSLITPIAFGTVVPLSSTEKMLIE